MKRPYRSRESIPCNSLTIPPTLSRAETLSWMIIEGAERIAREVVDLYLAIEIVAARREDGGLQDEAEDLVAYWSAIHATLVERASESLLFGLTIASRIVERYSVVGVRLALLEEEHADAMMEAYLSVDE